MNVISQIFKRAIRGDKYLIFAILFLMAVSILTVYSASSVLAYQKWGGDVARVIFRHCIMLFGGVLLLCLSSRIKPGIWSGLAWPFLFLAVGLQLLTLVAGTSINGSSRWLSVAGFTFQPSEISKVALMVFVAKQLASNMQNKGRAFWMIFGATCVVCALILLENLSTCVLIVFSVWVVMAVARIPFLYLGGTAAVVGGLLLLLITFAPELSHFSHVFDRAMTWRARIERFVGDDDADKAEVAAGNYQAEQARAAVSTGGIIFGKGPGNSYMKNFLPMAFSDFIFSIIIEEYGIFPGCFFVLLAYLTILARAVYVARHCRVPFRIFLVFGLAFMFTIQALINMAVGVDLIPVTGQTLPLVSMGGSSIFVMGMAYGIILSISNHMDEVPASSNAALSSENQTETL